MNRKRRKSEWKIFLIAAFAAFIITCLISFMTDIFMFNDEDTKSSEKPKVQTLETAVISKPEPEVQAPVPAEKSSLSFETFECTAYDLSVQSCGKLPSHPAYGITANGTNLRGQTREMAMAIAVDPNVIPMGSNVYIEFDGERSKYNGIYKAVDTGGAIKGHRIDVFFGDSQNVVSQEALNFGRANARVAIL